MVPTTARPTRRPDASAARLEMPGFCAASSAMLAATSMARSINAPEDAMNMLARKIEEMQETLERLNYKIENYDQRLMAKELELLNLGNIAADVD